MEGEKEILWEYRGSLFRLEEVSRWYGSGNRYEITGIAAGGTALVLPGSYEGKPVTRWRMRRKEACAGVKSLYIPAGLEEIFVENKLFPDLEKLEVEAGHQRFSTDGKMLYSADGRKLLYSLAAGNQHRAVVPAGVRKITGTAFRNAVCGEILFENPDVSVEEGAFEGCTWMNGQKDYCMIGNLFFRLMHSVKELRIPENARRFHERAFSGAVPEHLITPVMPSQKNMEDLWGGKRYGICRELTLYAPRAGVNFGLFRQVQGLRGFHIAGQHQKFCSREGVVFSKDGKCLEYYPQGRQERRYAIPEGVKKIARGAFMGQAFLEEIVMPDSVTSIGMSAFFRCRMLGQVRFSHHIREIPDAGAYQKGGVFEECTALKEVALPPKLQYLGSYAFCRSGLKKVSLNGKLRQMGEYALAAEGLRTVSLPSSLERMGKGALLYAEKLDACQGTAKGLVAAVNAVPPGLADKSGNVEWTRCMVRAYRKRGDRTEDFLIPGSVKRNAAYHLDMAWNGEEIDYTEYDACFDQVLDPEERLELAVMGILRTKGQEDSAYVTYMRHSAMKIASNLVETGKEEAFLAFLQEGYLSDAALEKLLKITNQKNMTICSAYILKYRKGNGARGQRRFAL